MYSCIPPLVLLVCSLAAPPDTVPQEDFPTQMMRATVKISHPSSTATGFILTVNDGTRFMLVTAAHVFKNTHGVTTEVIFRIKKADGTWTKEVSKLTIRKKGKPLWTQHPTEDVAALWIVPPRNADLARISPDLIASDKSLKLHGVHPGESLSLLGYPHREEANEAGFPILRNGPIASYPLLSTAKTRRFYLSANSFEGDSGGPVFLTKASPTNNKEVRLLVGLVHGQLFLDENIELINGGRIKLRHRFGLAIIVHAPFIRETIDRLR